MLTLFCFILILISVGYVYLIAQIYLGWTKTSEFIPTDSDFTGISVIIAARNEGNNITRCIQSIRENNYPIECFEIIVVDDHSTDNTASQTLAFNDPNVKLITQTTGRKGKKQAITLGISHAKFSIILCTDADCQVEKNWIKSHAALYQKPDVKISTGIVLPNISNSLLDRFQWLDFVASMAITANGIYRNTYFLANGANLSYNKATFNLVGGYEDNIDFSSGDDVFLINKTIEYTPKSAVFLKSKDTIVYTKTESDWASFLKQRKRWATKSMQMGDSIVIYIQSFVFLYSLLLLTGLILAVSEFHDLWPCIIFCLAIKMVTDYFFLNQLSIYFNRKEVMSSFIPCFFIYFGHILMSGYFALFPSAYDWKERKTK